MLGCLGELSLIYVVSNVNSVRTARIRGMAVCGWLSESME
jgi:hypothetical protein